MSKMEFKANNPSIEDFFMALFDPEEAVCFSKDVYSNEFDKPNNFNNYLGHEFFCINPVNGSR